MIKQLARSFVSTGLVLAGLAGLAPTTQAAFTVSATTGGSAYAGATYANFDGATLGATAGTPGTLNVQLGSTAAAVNGSAANQYAAPTLSGGNNRFFGPRATGPDATTYLSTGSSSITFTFGGATETYFGLLWGSVDAYNTLSFYDANGNLLQAFTGSAIGNADGASTVYANFISTVGFTSVVASSTANSFELDNVAFSPNAVPEPSSIALCGVAGVMGLVARKRRKRTA